MTRSADRILGGVCAGLAAHLGAPVALVRLVMVVFALFGGSGVLFYAWLWATVPAEAQAEVPLKHVLTKPSAQPQPGPYPSAPGPGFPAPSFPAPQAPAAGAALPLAPAPEPTAPGGDGPRRPPGRGFPLTELLLGVCLLIIGVALILFQAGVEVPLAVVLPTTVVLAGIALAWRQFSGDAAASGGMLPRILGALVLVAAGVLMFFITAREPNAWTIIAAAAAVLAGVGVALTPWLLRMNRELIA
ncbi:PspC domain-containing protein, partial [Leucobacter sp. M11]|uniref:PspC domain-containing protein n=1 Tax=Leucobacter sp. M11 TaxID=2993565 RepID=UPI002D7E265B